jgi:hypothetical protein
VDIHRIFPQKKCMDFIKEVQLLEAEAAMDIRKGE